MKIAAIIVTYNRINLLKKCVDSVRNQTYKVDEIIIINNSSTDGTLDWLNEQKDITTITQENCGGAGGFHTGIKTAYEKGYDWIWCMDDDTIAMDNSLENLIIVSFEKKNEEIGFLTSRVLWKDNSVHHMNLPGVFIKNKIELINIIDEEVKLYKIHTGSFVSIMFSNLAVSKIGYPNKDFFIYLDDTEYTLRMIDFSNYYVSNSRVYHFTDENTNSKFCFETQLSWEKSFYGLRNRIFFWKSINRIKVLSIILSYLRCLLFGKKEKIFRYKKIKLFLVAIYNGFTGRLGEYKKW